MFTSCDTFELKRTGTEPSLSLMSNGGLFIFMNFMSTNTVKFLPFSSTQPTMPFPYKLVALVNGLNSQFGNQKMLVLVRELRSLWVTCLNEI